MNRTHDLYWGIIIENSSFTLKLCKKMKTGEKYSHLGASRGVRKDDQNQAKEIRYNLLPITILQIYQIPDITVFETLVFRQQKSVIVERQ